MESCFDGIADRKDINMDLRDFFNKHPRVAVACSGGVDSTFLMVQAKKYAKDVKAYFVQSAFQPGFELEDARKCCEKAGVKLCVIKVDVLGDKRIADNSADRCYYCKKALFEARIKAAGEDGYTILLEGTNASDDEDDRPGMRALRALGVYSPLRECGMSKAEIRKQAKEEGIFTHAKPAYACLATRIPVGTPITADMLNRVEESERALFAMGFKDFRVRVYHGAARLQIRREEWQMFSEKRREIAKALQPFFSEVFLDILVER